MQGRSAEVVGEKSKSENGYNRGPFLMSCTAAPPPGGDVDVSASP